MVGSLPSGSETKIHGLILFNLDKRGDSRGWFEESWQQEKFSHFLPWSFRPLQQNISFNEDVGTLRGLHAEPWDKYVTVAAGRVFCAWVDLRYGDAFGTVETAVLEPGQGAFIPSGVANGYQTLEAGTSYVYLVNGHWNPSLKYQAVDPFDETLQVPWPISKDDAKVSPKDANNLPFREMAPRNFDGLILGAQGQLGKRLAVDFPQFTALPRDKFDISRDEGLDRLQVSSASFILNAAAFTSVDESQSAEGITKAYSSNVRGVKVLADLSLRTGATLVHYSSDYVFDGTKLGSYNSQDEPSPPNVYGLTKAAGEALASMNPKTYVFRTSWVFGDGENFVRKMIENAIRGKRVRVVDDQFGRPTSTETLSQATRHAISNRAPFGIYHISNSGPLASWFDIARFVYSCVGADLSLVLRSPSGEFASKQSAFRPANSDLGISDLPHFEPEDWRDGVRRAVDQHISAIGQSNPPRRPRLKEDD